MTSLNSVLSWFHLSGCGPLLFSSSRFFCLSSFTSFSYPWLRMGFCVSCGNVYLNIRSAHCWCSHMCMDLCLAALFLFVFWARLLLIGCCDSSSSLFGVYMLCPPYVVVLPCWCVCVCPMFLSLFHVFWIHDFPLSVARRVYFLVCFWGMSCILVGYRRVVSVVCVMWCLWVIDCVNSLVFWGCLVGLCGVLLVSLVV